MALISWILKWLFPCLFLCDYPQQRNKPWCCPFNCTTSPWNIGWQKLQPILMHWYGSVIISLYKYAQLPWPWYDTLNPSCTFYTVGSIALNQVSYIFCSQSWKYFAKNSQVSSYLILQWLHGKFVLICSGLLYDLCLIIIIMYLGLNRWILYNNTNLRFCQSVLTVWMPRHNISLNTLPLPGNRLIKSQNK